MTQSEAVRLANFSRWVSRSVDSLVGDGLTREEIASRGKISRDTLNKWTSGRFVGIPKAGKILDFCLGNSLDTLIPFEILGWVKVPRTGNATAGEAETPLPDVARHLIKVLRDPNVENAEKEFITSMIMRMIAPHIRLP